MRYEVFVNGVTALRTDDEEMATDAFTDATQLAVMAGFDGKQVAVQVTRDGVQWAARQADGTWILPEDNELGWEDPARQ